MILVVLFFVFAGLAIFHFWWDGIIAPSVRLEMRYELFKMRDSLRRLKIDHGEQVNDELFDVLQHMLNNELAFLHRATFGNLYFAYKRYGDKEDLKLGFEKFTKLVEESHLDEVKAIAHRSSLIVVCALIVNSGGWLVYVVPILLLAISYKTIQVLATKLLIGLTYKEVRTLFPDPNHAVFVS